MMRYFNNPPPETWDNILQRPALDTTALETAVRSIMDEVRQNGDAALRKFTAQFDKAEREQIAVSEEEINAAGHQLSAELKGAMQAAARNIRRFHEAQRMPVQQTETMPGLKCSRKSVPIQKVGLYVPGGSAPLFSTMLMLGIPARIAGCEEIIVCTPPQKDGSIHPAILYAAQLVGGCKIMAVGGVQAIAAMAYGTATVPRVYKIFGPGNQYVTCAKQLLAREGMAIDLPAGPSELAIFADESVPPAFVAADLLSQAEHGADSQVLLVAVSENVIKNVLAEIDQQLKELPRAAIAQEALQNSFAIRVDSSAQAMQLLNAYAPEHLILATRDAEALAEQVINAGSVFIGAWSPESVGDYASGTNHTLPTNGAARAWSGVSLDSFVKKITFQHISREALQQIGPHVEVMAAAEGLDAHRNAVSIRLKKME